MKETIHFYHTNDLHSHFEYWPRIQEFLAERKQLHEEAGEEMIVLDIGDHMDRANPYTEGTFGRGNIHLLNAACYQYVTIGNNEGITLSHEKLDTLYNDADFKVIAANLYYENGERPAWVLPSAIHTTANGLKIGLIGVTAFFQKYYELLGWKLTDPFEEIRNAAQILKEKTDLIVLLSHLGIYDDEKIAEEFQDIEVILGAHTHHVLHEGKEINHTLLCGAGKFGLYVGHVELSYDDSKISKTARIYETHSLKAVPNEKEFVEKLNMQGKEELSLLVTRLPNSLTAKWFEQSDLPSILCEALREWCGADCAFLNSGLLLDSLRAGDITKYDIHRICPHPINPCLVRLTGKELREVLLQSQDKEWPELQIKGFGFRGKVMGNMVYSQVEFSENNRKIFINGEPIDFDREYTLAIPDMFTFGRFFPFIQRTKEKEYFMPEFLRDVLEWKLKDIVKTSTVRK